MHEKAKRKPHFGYPQIKAVHEKGQYFVCMNIFLFSKTVFKKIFNLGALAILLPTPFLLLPTMFLSQPSQFPSYAFQHQNRTLPWLLDCPAVSQEASGQPSFTHSFMILLNKGMIVSVVNQMIGKYKGCSRE